MRSEELRSIADKFVNLAENLPDALAMLVQNVYNKLRDEFDEVANVTTRNLLDVTWENAYLLYGQYIHGDMPFQEMGIPNVSFPEYIEVCGNNKSFTFSCSSFPYHNVADLWIEYHKFDEAQGKYGYVYRRGYSLPNGGYITIDPGNVINFTHIRFYIQQWYIDTEKGLIPWKDLIPKDFQLELGEVATPYVQPQVICALSRSKLRELIKQVIKEENGQ